MRTINSSLETLALPGGGFAMLALDQRESLRQMIFQKKSGNISDSELFHFKKLVLQVFQSEPTSILLDYEIGFKALTHLPKNNTTLILAIDELIHDKNGLLIDTKLAPSHVLESIIGVNPKALKYLHLWSESMSKDKRLEIVSEFTEVCKTFNLPSVFEVIVRDKNGNPFVDEEASAQAMLRASSEISSYGIDLYKCEVPGHGNFDQLKTIRYSNEITENVKVPWVVLSNGVNASDFPKSVQSACNGGASGFLAGRAIWADAIKTNNPETFLVETSLERFLSLKQIVMNEISMRNMKRASAEKAGEIMQEIGKEKHEQK